MISAADIQKMADIIVERFSPEKIILFGSHATGHPTEDSDVDLLVVKETDEDLLDVAADIAAAVWHVPAAKDIMVRRPAQVAEAERIPWTVIHEALQKGRVLFDRSAA